MGGPAYFSHGTSAARGVALFAKKKYEKLIRNVQAGDDGRYLIFDLIDNELTITILALYAPNQDSPEFFTLLGEILKSRSEHKILIGDFNLAMDVDLDRLNTYNNNNKAKTELENIADQFKLLELWRMRNEDRKEYSWIKGGSKGSHRKASRIDFAMVTAGLDTKVEMIQYLSSIKTDHRAIYLVVDTSSFERGTGYWKFNNMLLQDMEFVQTMNKELDSTLMLTKEKAPQDRWETIKKRIKATTKKFSRNRTNEEKLIISNLSEKVNEYEASFPLGQEQDKIYEATKEELEEKLMKRISGVMFRSKAKWYEQGEKNTKYFFSLEKAKYNAKTCYKILNQEGKEITKPAEILSLQRDFYSELYKKDQDVHFNMENVYHIKVPTGIKEQQDIQIQVQELEKAIKQMSNNKTPGEDGIPIDFYKVFWTKLKDIFYSMVMQCFEQKRLHSSARMGILNLIPKANKDTRLVKNLRPITLLNTDYKIIEKTIANKMLPSLEHIIHKDQRGFMKNRRISVNIRKMLDIIHCAEKDDLEAVVLSLDFVKCFDKCSFDILHSSLDFFGFGMMVKEWTKILYKDFSVKIQNNGYFSEEISIEKGVHQGGCCSSLYFLVIAEILALAIRSNQDIEGITLGDIRNILNQFADDMDVFSINKESSIKAIYSKLEAFRQQSGFTVSYDKTTMYRIGSLRHSDAQLYNMSEFIWSNKDINVLGVTIAHEDLVQKNYQEIIEKTSRTLKAWNNRGLSLHGKVQVVNTLVASLFVYKMMVLPMIPKTLVKNIDNTIRDFLWDGRKSKIAYKTLQNPTTEGGLNLVNLENKDRALKATWPQILKSEEEYAQVVYKIMRCTQLGEMIWRCNIAPNDILKLSIPSKFWSDVWISWSLYNFYVEKRTENQIIWYNSNIRIAGKPVFWADAHSKGLLYVHQLFEQQKFKSFEEIQSQYGLTKLRFNSLKTAIPQEWKNFFQEQPRISFSPLPPHQYDKCGYQQKVTQKVYRFLGEDRMLIHNKFIKWRHDLGHEYQDTLSEFALACKEIYSITNVPKFRSFQYRLLHRGLVTNTLLEKWKMIGSNSCSFCGIDEETMIHLFTRCPLIIQLWQQIAEYITHRFTVPVIISAKRIIFNNIVEGKHVGNFICLVTKQYVYRQRCLKAAISFPALRTYVQNIENIEKYIAIKNSKVSTHNKKWGIMDQSLGNNLEEYITRYNDANVTP